MELLIKYREVNPQDIKMILKSFFGDSFAKSISINDKVVETVWEMVGKSRECTQWMNAVPRPTGIAPGASYIAKQIAGIAFRLGKKDNGQIYDTCKHGVAFGYSTKIRMAAAGL